MITIATTGCFPRVLSLPASHWLLLLLVVAATAWLIAVILCDFI